MSDDLSVQSLPVEVVPLASLTPHPQNYKVHPPEQIEHIAQSIKEHGIYRNVVVARDGTILAGHGVVEAARTLDLAEIPIIRVPLEPFHPRALKLLAGDNEVARLGQTDDRALALILKQISQEDETGLRGTGFDDKTLASLLQKSGLGEPTEVLVYGEGVRGSLPEEDLDDYLNSAIRQIVLPYPIAEYNWAINLLRRIQAEQGAETNTDAVNWLLEQYEVNYASNQYPIQAGD